MQHYVKYVVPGDCYVNAPTLSLGVDLPSSPAFIFLCWFHFLASQSILLHLWELILLGSSLIEINYSPLFQQPQWKFLRHCQLSPMSASEQITGSGGLSYSSDPGPGVSILGISNRVNSLWCAQTTNGESVSSPRKIINQDTEMKGDYIYPVYGEWMYARGFQMFLIS